MRATRRPQLRVMAADWSLSNYPTAKRPWSIRTKVQKVKDAGFDGMSSGSNPALAAELKKQGLELVGGVDVGSKSDAAKTLYAVPELGPQGSGYALACFPDIWKDAIREKDEIHRVWRRLTRKWKK